MQVRLTKHNESQTREFIKKSKKLEPGCIINPTQIVNRIYAEGIRRELKRFDKK